MRFKAQTDNNRKLDIQWDLINIYLSRWKPETWFDIDITRHQAKKSDPMRKYYFTAVVPTFAKHLGYEPDEHLLVHEQLKIRYFNIEPDKRNIYRGVPSVFGNDSKLEVSKKKEFVDWVIRKAAQAGCYIESPT